MKILSVDKRRIYQRTWAKEAYQKNPEKFKQRHMILRRSNPRLRLITSSRKNAKRRNLEHTITYKDLEILPKFCPYLGLELDYYLEISSRNHPSLPSIDRIDSSKGYVPGNIEIISYRANTLKGNSSIKELKLFAKEINARFGY